MNFTGLAAAFQNGQISFNNGRATFKPPDSDDNSRFKINESRASSDPDQGSANLTRAQFKFFEEKVKPEEQVALDAILDDDLAKDVGDRSAAEVRDVFSATEGSERRQLSRFGVTPTTDQRSSIRRRRGLDESLAIVRARSNTSSVLNDLQADLSRTALQIGRNISGQAAGELDEAAGLQRAREQAEDRADAQAIQNTVSSTATGAGIGFAVGKVPGAIIGGGIGLLASLL